MHDVIRKGETVVSYMTVPVTDFLLERIGRDDIVAVVLVESDGSVGRGSMSSSMTVAAMLGLCIEELRRVCCNNALNESHP